MKYVVILVPLLGLTTPVHAEETVDWDDLVERDGLFYKKFTDVPFTGEVTGQKQGRLKNGEKVD